MRGLGKGKRWLLLTRWVNLTAGKRRQLNELFTLNRRLLKAYLLKESLDHLWEYRHEGAMVRYFKGWMDQLRWQRLGPFQKLAEMLLDHFDGILNYCRTKVPLGVVEAINGNIKTLLRRGRGYRNLRYLLLKARASTSWRSCSRCSRWRLSQWQSFRRPRRGCKGGCVKQLHFEHPGLVFTGATVAIPPLHRQAAHPPPAERPSCGPWSAPRRPP